MQKTKKKVMLLSLSSLLMLTSAITSGSNLQALESYNNSPKILNRVAINNDIEVKEQYSSSADLDTFLYDGGSSYRYIGSTSLDGQLSKIYNLNSYFFHNNYSDRYFYKIGSDYYIGLVLGVENCSFIKIVSNSATGVHYVAHMNENGDDEVFEYNNDSTLVRRDAYYCLINIGSSEPTADSVNGINVSLGNKNNGHLTFNLSDIYIDEKNASDVSLGFDGYSKGFFPIQLKNGESKDLYYSVDANVSQDRILSSVSAKDLFGADVPVTVKSSNYEVGRVGDFTIVLNAKDSYDQVSTATLRVHVLDRTAPVVSQTSNITLAYGTPLTVDDVLSHLSITDNYSSTFTYGWTLPEGFTWNASFGAKNTGSKSFGLSVKDESGNETTCTIKVNVIDNVAPVISRKDGESTTSVITYGYSTTYKLTTQTLLDFFQASDDVDGSNLSVYVKSGEFDNGIGTHSIVIGSKDSAGNEATTTINYRIQADIPPVFILGLDLVGVASSIQLTKEDLGTLIVNANSFPVAQLKSKFDGTRIKYAKNQLSGDGVITDIEINDQDFEAYVLGHANVGDVYNIRYTYTDLRNGSVNNKGTLKLKILDSSTAKIQSGWDSFVQAISRFFTKDIPEFFTKKIPEFFQRLKNWITFKGWKLDSEL